MAVSKSSLKRRGKVFYLRFSENATRKRISLHTNSRETAKELQRRFDSARARGEGNVFPTQTPLASAVAAYIAHMKVARTRHGYTADLSYLRNAFGPSKANVLSNNPQITSAMMPHDSVSLLAHL